MSTILLATDGSPSAVKATAAAVGLAKATGWRLRVLAVWQMPAYDFGYMPLPYAPELVDSARQHAADVVEEAVEAARSEGVAATSELRRGVAVDEICAAAEDSTADLIVLGAHGWGALKRIVFGSVSTAVLHSAPCPVLVVRDDGVDVPEPAGAGAVRAEQG